MTDYGANNTANVMRWLQDSGKINLELTSTSYELAKILLWRIFFPLKVWMWKPMTASTLMGGIATSI